MASSSPPRSLRFATFEVDLDSGELRRSGIKIALQRQPFQILEKLLVRPGEVVTREEMQEKIWLDNTFVDFEHGLNRSINKLRQALNDAAENPRFIETLPRLGYRLIVPVTTDTGSGYKFTPVIVDRREAPRTAPPDVAPALSSTSEPIAEVVTASFVPAQALEPEKANRPKRKIPDAKPRYWISFVVILLVSFTAISIKSYLNRELRYIAIVPDIRKDTDANTAALLEGIGENTVNQLSLASGLRVTSLDSIRHYFGQEYEARKLHKDLGVDAVFLSVWTGRKNASPCAPNWSTAGMRPTSGVNTMTGAWMRSSICKMRLPGTLFIASGPDRQSLWEKPNIPPTTQRPISFICKAVTCGTIAVKVI